MPRIVTILALLFIGFLLFKLPGTALASLAIIPFRYYKLVLVLPVLVISSILYFDYVEHSERVEAQLVVQDIPPQNGAFTLEAFFHPQDDPYLNVAKLPRFFRGVFKPLDGCEYAPLAWFYTTREYQISDLSRQIDEAEPNECGFVGIEITVARRNEALQHQRSVLRMLIEGKDIPIIQPEYVSSPTDSWPTLEAGYLKEELTIGAIICMLGLAIFAIGNWLGLPKWLWISR